MTHVTTSLRLLIIEDSEDDAVLACRLLRQGGYTLVFERVDTARGLEHALNKKWDVIISDYTMPHFSGYEALKMVRRLNPEVPFIFVSGTIGEDAAIDAMRGGAQDYVLKRNLKRLVPAVQRELQEAQRRGNLKERVQSDQVILNFIDDAVLSTDLAGNVTYLNLAAEKMTGWSSQEAAGRPMAEVFRLLDTTGRGDMRHSTQPADGQLQPMHWPPHCTLARRDGVEVPIEHSSSPIHDHQGKISGAVTVVRDVTVARAMSQQVTHLAQHDGLTGLPNRMLLNDRINQAIALASRHAKKLAVLFLDLDGFKHINDSLGHPIGDKLLQSIASRLVNCLRASDTVSRQGGDEFVVLLSELAQSDEPATMARRILESVAVAHTIGPHTLHVTTSIGLSIYPDDGLDAETLIKNSDIAMYHAKENGRQTYEFFTPVMNARAVERQSIEESLRHALERQEFTLQYQPKVNLKSGEITGAEALIRWTHPIRGEVPPELFIPVAEDCGLILPIGNWVLGEACKQARAWADAGLPPTIMAVNISAREFRHEHFLERVLAILEGTGLDPKCLELELTESVLMKRAEHAESILKTLRERGVQIAIDDFGTGYSSLSYLTTFSIDTIKIDQTFVRKITTSPNEATIVPAIISMGRSLKMRVVAEGVETQEELAFLQANQCEEAQGYYFGRPVQPEEFVKLLTGGKDARYRQLSDTSPDPVLVHSDGCIVYANRATAKLLQLQDPQMLLGQRLDRFVNPASQRDLLTRRTGELAASLRRSDGATVYVEIAASMISMGDQMRTLLVCRDVTARVTVEHELLDVAAREQAHLAHDLHDGLGQQLTGIALLLRGLGDHIVRELPAHALEFERIGTLVSKSIEDMRRLATGMSPIAVERAGLADALTALSAQAKELYGLQVVLEIDPLVSTPIDSQVASQLYRIVQEAVSNVARHAHATLVQVIAQIEDLELTLTIADNGIGLEHALRLRNAVALRVVDAEAAQHVDDLDVLGEFGDGLLAGQMADLVDRAHHLAVDGIVQDFLDEAAVDLQEIHREMLQSSRTMTGRCRNRPARTCSPAPSAPE
jgi:diguanylate cyclase (GGDEF)-like protein/PAS domain S-box-containing protein